MALDKCADSFVCLGFLYRLKHGLAVPIPAIIGFPREVRL
jgi:hypothetical protein